MKNSEDGNDIAALEAKLSAAKAARIEAETPEHMPPSATRFSIELLAGVGAGAGLGYYADRYFDTFPVLFIIGFFFGVAAAALNIYKLVSKS